MLKISEAKSQIRLSQLIGQSINLKSDGQEFWGICPFHQEATPSFSVNDIKGFYHCFGCGAHGDHFDFLKHTRGLSLPQAMEYLTGKPLPDAKIIPLPRRIPDSEWRPIMPVPDSALLLPAQIYNPKRNTTVTLKPEMTHAYRDSQGQLLGYVYRCYLPNGSKFTPQITYCRNQSGEYRWCMQAFPVPRPLYGLDLLAKYPEKPVVVVEGEKCADILNEHTQKYVTVSWSGGCNAVNKADWTPLKGRTDITLWPDNDDAGREAMRQVTEILKGWL